MARAIRIVLLLIVLAIVLYRWVMPPVTPLMLARYLETGKLAHNSVPLAAISSDLQRALVASEDGQFCRHRGVSWDSGGETGGAKPGFLANAESIDMAAAQSLFLWPGGGTVPRLLAVPLAYAIDFVWPKRRIVELYLNVAEWGEGIYGAEAAAQAFFNKSAAKLSRNEAVLMAAALADPAQSSPARPSPAAIARATRIAGKIDSGRFDYGCLR